MASPRIAIALVLFCCLPVAADEKPLRPPAVPLVTCDPYFSIWSPADKLTDAATVHWTGKRHRLSSLVRIDGKAFRLMGTQPAAVPALPQSGLVVLPTRTVYQFQGEGIHLSLQFLVPALADDLDVLSWPACYVTWTAQATDSKDHNVSIYFDSAAELVVDQPKQTISWEHLASIQEARREPNNGSYTILKMGSQDQPVLGKKGDDLRIDWGYLYLQAGRCEGTIAAGPLARNQFVSHGTLPRTERQKPRPAGDIVAACAFDLGNVGGQAKTCSLIMAYDDLYSIQYFRKNLRPYWRRNGLEAVSLLNLAMAQRDQLFARCERFDREFMADCGRIGGEKYAQLCALAYRQCLAANKIVADTAGAPLLFPKENFSNGCIATVDVIYPMAPQFLLFSPTLTRAMLVPILDYAASPRWRWPFAPHDLGTYPLANGQVYGGGERTETDQMPVEETGNMLVLLAALAQVEGNADFAGRYWPTLLKWADYLKAKGFDPENQLCTDDFAGHLAHNVNLSAKAICGLGAFAKLCDLRGEHARRDEYHQLAKEFARRWLKEADDGDHFRLAFDRPGTWSQKYNLVWDKILGLDLFPEGALRKEMEYYKKKQNRYGLPLDNRQPYTKLDWTVWTATLTGDRDDFPALVDPLYAFLNETPDRVPMTDWYQTQSGKKVGFQARSVVGGVFIKMLYDKSIWKKWASRDKTKAGPWAPLPKPPRITPLVPSSELEGVKWRYTTHQPGSGWYKTDFNDSSWLQGPGGFGTEDTPGAVVRTTWATSDIWLRREFVMPDRKASNPGLWLHHDEDVEVYLNGIRAAKMPGFVSAYEFTPISSQARSSLHSGKNIMAVHCHQTTGGQYIDVGIVEVEDR